MSAPFKMKGWSGNQSPSPIRQPKNLQASLANIQKSISNTLKGIGTNIRKHVKPQSESSGFGLTNLEKAQAKKHGMSEWQWKTDRSKSGTRANRYARDNKLGKYADKTKFVDENKDGIPDYIQPIHSTGIPGPGYDEVEPSQEESTSTEVDYGTGMTTKDWKQESSTGWSLHELTQERKKFDPGSPEYDKIQKAINLGYKTGGPVEPLERAKFHYLGKSYSSLFAAEEALEEAKLAGKDKGKITGSIDGKKVTPREAISWINERW